MSDTPPAPAPADVAALEELSRSRAIGRTVTQVSVPAAIVGVGGWLAGLLGLDLDKGAGIDLPSDVSGYLVALLAAALCWRMNRKTKPVLCASCSARVDDAPPSPAPVAPRGQGPRLRADPPHPSGAGPVASS